MEMAVGFAATNDGSELSQFENDGRDYSQFYIDESVLGKVYIPKEGVTIAGPIAVRYERHPWIECFEIDGILALRPKRSGFGTKNAKGFVASLNSIYAKAYDDYADFATIEQNSGADGIKTESFDASGYFARVTDRFVSDYRENGNIKMFKKYCGFVENMWREGDEEMYHVAMEIVIPALLDDEATCEIFHEVITDEFRTYLGV